MEKSLAGDELILKVADAIEEAPELYDQGTFGLVGNLEGAADTRPRNFICDTPCCVAGWALILSKTKVRVGEGIAPAAAKAMGLDPDKGAIFSTIWPMNVIPEEEWPENYDKFDFIKPTPSQAAHALRRLVAGELTLDDWNPPPRQQEEE